MTGHINFFVCLYENYVLFFYQIFLILLLYKLLSVIIHSNFVTENVRLCQRLGNGSLDNGDSRSSNKLQHRTSSRKDMTPLLNAVNKMQDTKSGQESPEGNGILKKPWVLSMMYGKNSGEEGGDEGLLDGENDADDAASTERKKILQLKRENTVKDLTQKLSSQNIIHSPVEEGNNKNINR